LARMNMPKTSLNPSPAGPLINSARGRGIAQAAQTTAAF
jgi:hypothetical protein